jgi:CBS domain-containing protein
MTEAAFTIVPGEGKDVPSPREFLRVAKVVPADQEILSVLPGTKVREALDLMDERGFSQLPVVVGGTVIGVFSYRSLAHGLRAIRSQDDPLELPIDELLEDLVFARPAASLSEVLDWIERDGAILLGDDDNLIAVATASDVARFLWETTYPFILIRDIELAVRDLMRRACRSESELQQSIDGVLPHPEDKDGKMLEDLTLGQLIRVLLDSANFDQYFHRTFGRSSYLVESKLDRARIIRNSVFHFVGDVPAEEMRRLYTTWRWLERKALTAKAQS